MSIKHVRLFAVLAALAGCGAVGPDYARPNLTLADRFALSPQSALRDAAAHQWWTGLNDASLNAFVARGLTQNLSLQQARARIQEAQAQVRATGLGNQGSAEVSANVTWSDGAYSDSSAARVGGSFLFDIFGENQRRREQASASLEAAVFDAAAARLEMQSAVVQTYLDARYFQVAGAVRRQTIANRARLVNILQERNRLGDATKLSLRRAQAELALQRAELPQLEAGLQTSAFALATLLSEPGDRVLAQLTATSSVQPVPKTGLSPGVPAALLHNRPDIRAAEARFAAAVAEIGIAEAQLYPTLRLSGDVTASAANTVSIGPALSLPIFDRTVRQARRDAARARALQSEITWRRTVLEAVEDVQSGLARTHAWDRQVTALNRALATYSEAIVLSREAFELNAITLSETLTAEDNLSAASLRLAEARRSYAASWAGLNVALGQGWNADLGDTARQN